MPTILVILAYLSAGGQGGLGLDVETIEFDSMAQCQAVGESQGRLAESALRWTCVELPPA